MFTNFTVLEPPAKVFSSKFGSAIPTYVRFLHSAKVFSVKWSHLPDPRKFSPLKVFRYMVPSSNSMGESTASSCNIRGKCMQEPFYQAFGGSGSGDCWQSMTSKQYVQSEKLYISIQMDLPSLSPPVELEWQWRECSAPRPSSRSHRMWLGEDLGLLRMLFAYDGPSNFQFRKLTKIIALRSVVTKKELFIPM